jgi:hypothetical protein
MNDCEALAEFSETVADGSRNNDQFIRDFSVLVPSTWATTTLPGIGIPSNTASVALNLGQASGYSAAFQNSPPDNPQTNGDQGHHFAAFFEYGYLHSAGNGAAAAITLEGIQALFGLKSVNTGDINLGIAAALLGESVRNGTLDRAAVGSVIRATICQP